ncbi:MAG TPA: helix-turn-helix transcriptional regulator [Hyphomicrobiaceae bacterium]
MDWLALYANLGGMPNSIRHWRKRRGLTLEQLAPRVGMTAGNLSRMERGEIPYTSVALEALSKALGCKIVDLVIESDSPDLVVEATDELRHLTEEQRQQAVRLIRALRAA